MARFRKDALYAGQWHLPDGRVFRCTPADLRHYRRRAKDMLAAGLSIPVCWNHQDVAPVTAAERMALRERNTLGWVEDAHDAGPLEFDIEAPVESDADRLKAVRFVSPEIQTDFRDGTGRLWPGKSITHVAVTGRPVQTGQRPFARLSHTQNGQPIRLSLEGYRMAEDMEPDGDEGGEGESDGAGVACPPALIEALREAKLNIPDECVDLQHLIIAIKANKPAGEDEAPAEDEPADVAGDAVEGAAPASPPISMSLDRAEKDELEALRREKTERDIKDLQSVSNAVKAKLASEFGAVRMSQDGGRARADFLVKLKAYQDLPPLAINAGPRDRLSMDGVVAVPNPQAAAEDEKAKARDLDIAERAKRLSVSRAKP